ncbi:MAG: hypothetical protein AAGN82_17745 [Myxococcota bacterium]
MNRSDRLGGPLTRTITPPGPLDVRRSMSTGYGARDPGTRRDHRGLWRATHTPDGPCTLLVRTPKTRPIEAGRLVVAPVEIWAWGPGAAYALAQGEHWLGFHDDPSAFVPQDAVLARAKRRHPGLRMGRGRDIFEVLLPTILGQRVKSEEASQSWRQLCYTVGAEPPGLKAGPRAIAAPCGLRLPARPERLKRISLPDYHRFGVEMARARTLLEVCHHIGYVARAAEMPAEKAVPHLVRLPGIGPWTAMLTVAAVHGFADAIPVGDYHIPSVVAYALKGEPRANDARLLELLEPYRGQRWRVIRLLGADRASAPRFGPKRATFGVHVALATQRGRRNVAGG